MRELSTYFYCFCLSGLSLGDSISFSRWIIDWSVTMGSVLAHSASMGSIGLAIYASDERIWSGIWISEDCRFLESRVGEVLEI